MEPASVPVLLRKPWTEKRLLKWLFVFITAIASIQFFQNYLFYNSSYPFPYLQYITASYLSFYTYFLFVPIIFKASKFAESKLHSIAWMILFHLVVGAMLSAAHLLLIHFIGWLQVYQWSEESFFSSYLFQLSKWLHFEILIYGFLVFIWKGLDYMKWTQLKQTEETAEAQKSNGNFVASIKVKEGGNISFISVNEIRWIEAYDNYIKIRVNGRYFLVRQTLSSIERALNPEFFQRIHRSVIVAIEQVESIRVDNGNYQVVLSDQTPLKLSRTYKDALEQQLSK